MVLVALLFAGSAVIAQTRANPAAAGWATSPGVLGTLILIALVALIPVIILSARLSAYLELMKKKEKAGAGAIMRRRFIRMM